ncbi:MAG: DUF554 domain-containing protein [Acholeplasmataceae bacterium]|nr:DUF554 domain-containing protein [Acholeplasmataceae bacterium]
MGTLINVAAIIVASILGVIFKKGLPEKIQKSIMLAMGLGLIAISLGMFFTYFLHIEGGQLKSSNELLVILSLVIGVIIGEWIDIDSRLSRGAENIEKKYNLPPLAKGFIAGTLIFCVGAMAILGPIQDATGGGISTLLIKSTLDFVTALVLASSFGIGVIFSAFSVLIYQGAITLVVFFASDIFPTEMIQAVSMVGSILLIAIGINFMELRKIKVANMLPALLVPVIYYLIISFI